MTVPAHRDWSRPELRAQVRPGSILHTEDYYCFPVTEVCQTGVRAWFVSEWKDFSWEELTGEECGLYEQMELSEIRYAGPMVQDRGGRLDDFETRATPGPYSPVPQEDYALARALGGVLPTGRDWVEIRAECRENELPLIGLELLPGGLPMTRDIRQAVTAHHAELARIQWRSWTTLEFRVNRRGREWRYSAEFGYE